MIATSTAIVLATAPSADGGPAALLPWDGATILRRLVGQLESLGVPQVHVLARPGDEAAVRAAVEATGADVRASAGLHADLVAIAALVDAAPGGVVVLGGEIITHREALAGLLADPRVATGILSAGHRVGRPFAPKLRGNRGRIVSAASPYHFVRGSRGNFLGVLKVSPTDRPALLTAARELAALTENGLPDGWADELERKGSMWRGWLARAAARRALLEEEHGGPIDDGAPSEFAESSDADGGAGDEEIFGTELEISEEDERLVKMRLAAAREDATSLLLVALVRDGVHVAATHLRKLFWARPLSAEGIERAEERIVLYDEDKVLLDSAVKATDGFFTTFFVSPYSKYLARWAARRGFTPNQITTVSLLIGILAAAAFATGERWGLITGAVLVHLAFVTDCVDGQLARYTRTFSKLGAWLDSIFDRSKEYVVFAGLAIGGAAMGQDDIWILAGAALTLQTLRHQLDFAFAAARHQVIGATEHPPLAQPDDSLVPGRPAPGTRVEQVVPVDQPVEKERRPFQLRDVPNRILRLWRKLDKLPFVVWVKRIIQFPIGERFATIAITAALFTPRTTFIVVLAAGGFAGLYQLTGRVLRSIR